MLDTAGGLHGMMSRLPVEEERPRKVSEVKGSKAQGLHESEARGRGQGKVYGVGGGGLSFTQSNFSGHW